MPSGREREAPSELRAYGEEESEGDLLTLPDIVATSPVFLFLPDTVVLGRSLALPPLRLSCIFIERSAN